MARKYPLDENTNKILSTASQLGIKYYRMGYLSYDESLEIEKSLERHRATLSELSSLNEKYNIHGAYQNHAGTKVGAPVWDLWCLIRDLDPRWMGCQYDIKHATVEGGRCWPLGLRLLHKHIKITAIKDFKWVFDNGEWHDEHVPLTQGMVDFVAYFNFVKQYDISGPISTHFEYPLGGANRGSKHLTTDTNLVFKAMRRDLSVLRKWVDKYIL